MRRFVIALSALVLLPCTSARAEVLEELAIPTVGETPPPAGSDGHASGGAARAVALARRTAGGVDRHERGALAGLAGARSLTDYGFLDFFWPIVPMVGGAF